MTGRRFEADNQVEPTFTGYIETTLDALLIFEACRQRVIPKISRRLHDKERHLIQSGSVFVFQETEAGIKRWTDGLVWSPSRILGNFLIYRELNKKSNPNSPSFQEEQLPPIIEPPKPTATQLLIGGHAEIEAAALRRQKERALVGSLTGSPKYREGGLMKKTISLAGLHMISYYDVNEVLEGKLRTPSSLPELAILEPSPDLLNLKGFRQPPLIEIGPDGTARYRAENAGSEQAQAQAAAAQQQSHASHHAAAAYQPHQAPAQHMMPIPQRGPVPVPHHLPRMPPMQLPVPPLSGPPSAPHSAVSAGSASGSSHSAGYISPDTERPNPMLSLPSGTAVQKSPLEAELARPALPRSKSSGAPAKQGALAHAASRYEPYPQLGRRNAPSEQRPHTSAGDMHESTGHESEYSRYAMAYGMPTGDGRHDERYAPAYAYGYHPPSYIPAPHLPMPIPYAHGGYDPYAAHHGSYPVAQPIGRRSGSGSYESESNFAYRPESPQTSRSNGVDNHYSAVAKQPRSTIEHPHPASAPAGQTSFQTASYSAGGHQPSGLVASSSPEPDDHWLERS